MGRGTVWMFSTVVCGDVAESTTGLMLKVGAGLVTMAGDVLCVSVTLALYPSV